jgi:hypothetical protein
VAELLAAHHWLEAGTVPSEVAAVRRAVAATKEVPIETTIEFLRSVVAVDGDRDSDADGDRDRDADGDRDRELAALLDRLAGSVAELRRTEPDLDAPAALLTGAAVIELLGIEEGPEVGRAMQWLRELRLDEGIVAPEEAARRLADWWVSGERD